jgi:hypothetical protein
MDRDDHGGLPPPGYGQPRNTPATAPTISNKLRQPLRYRKRPLLIFLIYTILMVVPWGFTCAICFSPAIKSNKSLRASHYDLLRQYMKMTPHLNTISALFSLPIVSSLLAHGAVVYCQRRNPHQKLNANQLLSLASRSWNSPFKSWASSSSYLKFAMTLFLLGMSTLIL